MKKNKLYTIIGLALILLSFLGFFLGVIIGKINNGSLSVPYINDKLMETSIKPKEEDKSKEEKPKEEDKPKEEYKPKEEDKLKEEYKPKEEDKPKKEYKPDHNNELTTSEIKEFLLANYGTLDTNIGTTKFSFDIYENKYTDTPYDYWIRVKYEYGFFEGAINKIDYSTEQKNKLRQELKEHQKNMGEALIELLPNKKLSGGYHDSWYKYPNIKVERISVRYYSWTSYDEPDWALGTNAYDQTTPSYFRWYDIIDDEL